MSDTDFDSSNSHSQSTKRQDVHEPWQRSLEIRQQHNEARYASNHTQAVDLTETGVTVSTQHHQQLDQATVSTEVATSTLPTDLSQDEELHDGDSDLMIISEEEDDRLITDEGPVQAVALNALHYDRQSQPRIATALGTGTQASLQQPLIPNVIGAVLCCTTVELPIYQASAGRYIRIVPGTLPHGHISNVPAIADPEVREWFSGNVGSLETRAIFVQPNGDVHELIMFGRPINHAENAALLQGLDVHDALQRCDRMAHNTSERVNGSNTIVNALNSGDSNSARRIIYTSHIQLPVVRTPSGHIVQFGACNVVHGHINDIAGIQEETVRECYTNPSNNNSAEPVCTLRDGTIIETVAANKIVGRADDLTTVQDPVVRGAMAI